MKKIAKTISIILCIITIFTSIPLNAFAGAPIYNIGLTFDTNIHGESIEDYREFITIDYGEVTFYSKDGSLPVTATPLDGSAFNGKFEGGKTYEISITLAPENATYYLTPYSSKISFSDPSIYRRHSITFVQYGTDYMTVFAEVTIDEPTVIQQISDFFVSFFEKIQEFFLNLFKFK